MDQSSHINYFAQTDFRGRKITFGIKSEDRARHMYVIGKTGMGKSTMLENLAIQDIKNGEGMCFIDPHGKTAELLLEYIPKERLDDVLYIAPFDLDYPIAFNVMEDVGKDRRHLVAAGLMSAFKKIWVDAWSARMEYILNNTILALLEYPGSTLLSVNKMISDKKFREKVVACVTDPGVRSFWVDEFANYTERFAAEATPAIQNKVGQFTSNPLIRNILGQTKSSFDFRELMDQKKIVIINLSKGLIGEGNANLIGSMLITKIYLAAMSRANVSDAEMTKLPPFYLYVDEFQSFANESFADILSEARKYKLSLTIAHQYIEQMPEEVRDAVFGNVGTTVVFRVGPFDAEVFEKVFFPTFTKEDLVSLGFAQIYMSLMIDGIGSKPFSAVTLPPIPALETSFKEEVVRRSRSKFTKPRAEVESEVMELHATSSSQSNHNSASNRPRTSSNSAPSNNGRRAEERPRESRPKVEPSPQSKPAPTHQPAPSNNQRQEPNLAPVVPSHQAIKITERSAVSLGHLKERSVQVANNSKSTEKSRDALRSALQELMQNRSDQPKVKTVPVEKPVALVDQLSTSTPAPKGPTDKQEIPEEVLRQMLDVKK
ncbi:MAG: hypothetical protein A2589_02340 [Candidatus Vogelbacteria bacterium RIFOXYD1_FULL_46_19]|uniref:Type IV secretion system coupling protein TraD DNA-binding domain-containing protein n=1 Tax=Candidatus Vogelbacteria bacterium RIFOXYD1_FULL_46_19 TaxID=1802439 RepID=A0A1G2QH33_9BACT|nr:MAG: hypothetical protein A2589_02340 [Candidatus Vogelbacteria bacterium RIFOXYD1_FULL_46_19]